MKRKLGIIFILAAAFVLQLPAITKGEDLGSLKEQLRQLNARIEKMESRQAKAVYQSEIEELRKEVAQSGGGTMKLPKWLDNLKFYGDLRLRYQNDHKSKFSGSDKNLKKDKNRVRFRVRVGMKKTFWEKQMELGFRLASGSSSDNDSTNQTFDKNFSKKDVWIDLAYAKYMPKVLKGLTVTGGKMKNPIRSRTWMTWDSDINPEGFFVDYVAQKWDNIKPYAQAGYYILEDAGNDGVSTANHHGTLWVFGGGFEWKPAKNHKLYTGASYYNFNRYNINTIGDSGISGDWYNEDGNPGARMNMVEVSAKYTTKVAQLPLSVYGSWVKNTTGDYDADNPGSSLSQLEGQNDAYLAGIKYGKNKTKGDWSVKYEYCWMEANSVPKLASFGGLTDSDFGGPNRKGSIIAAVYNIDKFLTISGKVFFTNEIETIPGGTAGASIVQVDLKWKF